jgi:enamine deaminase RidA (YjgF/YER057c/UK114 family)
MSDPYARLRELGITLPKAPAPAAAYLQTRVVSIDDDRAFLYVAGQVSADGDQLLTGRCPDQVSVEEATRRARLCATRLLAQIDAAVGLDKVEAIAQLVGYVNSTPDFGDQPKVMNGASELIVQVLGDAGKHTRAALGTNALPFSVTIEIMAVAVVRTR